MKDSQAEMRCVFCGGDKIYTPAVGFLCKTPVLLLKTISDEHDTARADVWRY